MATVDLLISWSVVCYNPLSIIPRCIKMAIFVVEKMDVVNFVIYMYLFL